MILDRMDKDKNLIKHRLYRQHCVEAQDRIYVKDLSIIKDRNLKDVVLVDNSIISFAFNMDSGVPIKSYYRDDKEDEELLYMANYLEEAHQYPDIRQFNKVKFKLSEIQEKIK